MNGTDIVRPSRAIELFEIVSILVICLLGVIGNILVVLVVCRQRKMRTVTNYLIVNLAFADLFVLLINVPLDTIVKLSGDKWLYGAAMCKLIPPFQTMATTVSVWSLVAISIGRYIAIVHPFRPQLQTRHAKWTITVVWLIGLVVVIPYMCALELKDGSCSEDFEAAGMKTAAFTVGVFFAQYLVPLSIIVVSYARIAREICRSGKGHENSELIKEQRKETRKVIKILRFVVLAFAVLVLPIHLLYIWWDFFNGATSPMFKILKVTSLVMLYSNSACNPIIYNVSNEQFRDGFRQYFKPCLKMLCPWEKCKEQDVSNGMKETDLMSLYDPRSSISHHNGYQGRRSIEVKHGPNDAMLSRDSTCTAV